MRLLLLIAAGTLAGLLGSAANAEPLLKCKPGEDPSLVAAKACADKSFIAFDKSISSAFDAAIAAAADRLTATLLRQEDQRRTLIMDSTALITDDGQVASGRAFLRKSMLRDKAILDAISRHVPDGLAGQWSNAFATIRLVPRSADHYRMTIERSWVEKELDVGMKDQVSHCSLQIDIARAPDGWYGGKVNSDDSAPTRVIRQGASLRMVLGHAKGDTDDNVKCGFHDALTGTYFLTEQVADTAHSTGANPVEKPSFNCKDADGAIEMEICADPDLARQDRMLVTAFKAALGRLDAETGKYLRADQRAWIARRSDIYIDALSPAANKSIQQEDDYGGGRQSLLDETKSQIDLLNSIEARRPDFVGKWASMGSTVSITRGADGQLDLTGGNAAALYHEGECEYETAPKVANGVLTADVTYAPNDDDGALGRATPKVWSDGRTLVIDGDLEERPDGTVTEDADHPSRRNYCTRIRSSTDRLFPIKGEVEDKKAK